MSFEGNGLGLFAHHAEIQGETGARLQHGALCYKLTRKGVLVLLVTSRDTGRWLLPKGWPNEGLTPAQSAAREARDEGGVEGVVWDECLGLIRYEKFVPGQPPLACIVAVFPLRVQALAPRYREKHQRRRKWLTPEQAAALVQEPDAAELLLAFSTHPLVQPVSEPVVQSGVQSGVQPVTKNPSKMQTKGSTGATLKAGKIRQKRDKG